MVRIYSFNFNKRIPHLKFVEQHLTIIEMQTRPSNVIGQDHHLQSAFISLLVLIRAPIVAVFEGPVGQFLNRWEDGKLGLLTPALVRDEGHSEEKEERQGDSCSNACPYVIRGVKCL